MKLLLFSFTIMLCSFLSKAQDFTAHLTTARTAYTGGKLEDARFAMQQMMQELDMLTGKEVLSLLPQKLDTMNVNPKNDLVSGTSGFAGVVIHRDFGKRKTANGTEVGAELEVITNSPLIGTLNTLLSLPFMGNNPDQKVIKIAGYKALVQKISGDDETSDYEIQLPLTNSLVTLKAPGLAQEKVIALMNTLPIAEIAKRIQ